MASLFDAVAVDDLQLSNRMVMAPLTRSRAGQANVPTELMATYYSQRASAGLIITEASQVSPQGQGYIATPGIHSAEQIAGWKTVTDAVHAAGGKLCLQLWHVGRISHSFFQPDGAAPVAPSAIQPAMKAYTDKGFEDCPVPRALETAEVQALVQTYRQAAQNAKAAGFDMVEIHAANGYLIDQFLRDKTNQRTDAYGGSIENRARFLMEVVNAVLEVYPAHRVGCRISPVSQFNDIDDSNPAALFGYLAQQLGARKLGYLHIIEGQTGGSRDADQRVNFEGLRQSFKQAGGRLTMVNNGYTREMALSAVTSGSADLVAFGVPFLANPDLVSRFQHGQPLNTPDQATFYGGGEKGYTDYPVYAG
jgi:N-ethylmaleimide reductase